MGITQTKKTRQNEIVSVLDGIYCTSRLLLKHRIRQNMGYFLHITQFSIPTQMQYLLPISAHIKLCFLTQRQTIVKKSSRHLSSIWREIDPDTACVVWISVSLVIRHYFRQLLWQRSSALLAHRSLRVRSFVLSWLCIDDVTEPIMTSHRLTGRCVVF